MITVVNVDYDPFVPRGVMDIFAKAPDIAVVADVGDGDLVPAAVAAFRPHLVLINLRTRRVGGLDCTRELMTRAHPPKVVAMTARDVDDFAIRAIAAGAQLPSQERGTRDVPSVGSSSDIRQHVV